MGGEDARTLSVLYTAEGEQYREFSSAVEAMSETKMENFIVKGPRTVLWVLRFMKENGGTPLGRHARFKTDAGLKPDDAGVVMHASLCKILQVACTSDQLDASNLGSMELVCRELQMI